MLNAFSGFVAGVCVMLAFWTYDKAEHPEKYQAVIQETIQEGQTCSTPVY